MVVSDSQFIGNWTNSADVGALYAGDTLIITDTDFISNTAGDDNGAVWATGNITVTNSLFQGNRAAGDDFGAIESGGDLTVVNSEFIGNSAADDMGTLAVDGAATGEARGATGGGASSSLPKIRSSRACLASEFSGLMASARSRQARCH